ncbi:MAG: TrkH family potassium uptake protein, partial [Ignavibacteriales bacterium]|nr:TrkH family potassium uptake protein [Ignavibacteriales bacterium]
MRFQVVIRYIAYSLLLSALFMLISAMISSFNAEASFMPLLYSSLVTAMFGVFPIIFIPHSQSITNKEGLLIVVGSWLLACIAGTIPYLLWGGVFNFENAWFESVSGFTTTGSSILADVESLPMGMLFWRAATHWIGGVGIILFVLSVLPNLGNAEIILYRSEVSSVVQENFNLQAKKAIHILAGTYVVLTILETIFLMISGVGWFDAITHSFATIATGGFSTKNASIASFNS